MSSQENDLGGTKEHSRREENVGADTAITLASGECDGVTATSTRVRVLRVTSEIGTEAAEGDGTGVNIVGTGSPPGTRHGVTDDHAGALGEGRDLLVAADGLNVIDGHTTIRVAGELVSHLGDLNTNDGDQI